MPFPTYTDSTLAILMICIYEAGGAGQDESETTAANLMLAPPILSANLMFGSAVRGGLFTTVVVGSFLLNALIIFERIGSFSSAAKLAPRGLLGLYYGSWPPPPANVA